MKGRMLRHDLEFAGNSKPNPESVHLVQQYRNHEMVDVLCWKVGAVIDDPMVFRLVQMGVAEPADNECEKRANMTPAKMAAAIHAYERTNKGIHPDDFERYESGELAGYDTDGSDIPGPNFIEEEEEEEEDDE